MSSINRTKTMMSITHDRPVRCKLPEEDSKRPDVRHGAERRRAFTQNLNRIILDRQERKKEEKKGEKRRYSIRMVWERGSNNGSIQYKQDEEYDAVFMRGVLSHTLSGKVPRRRANSNTWASVYSTLDANPEMRTSLWCVSSTLRRARSRWMMPHDAR